MLRNSSSLGMRNWRLKVGVTAMRSRVARCAALLPSGVACKAARPVRTFAR
jgi:hypothetical protein